TRPIRSPVLVSVVGRSPSCARAKLHMKNSATKALRLTRGLLLLLGVLVCHPAWGGNVNVTLVYTQANINDDNSVVASFGTVGLQYTLATNTLTLSNNTTLLSQTQNPNFWCADGIVVDPQNGNFLVAGCGDDTLPGSVFQLTPNGAEASPFSFSFSPPLIAYSDFALTIVPANGSQSGFQ